MKQIKRIFRKNFLLKILDELYIENYILLEKLKN